METSTATWGGNTGDSPDFVFQPDSTAGLGSGVSVVGSDYNSGYTFPNGSGYPDAKGWTGTKYSAATSGQSSTTTCSPNFVLTGTTGVRFDSYEYCTMQYTYSAQCFPVTMNLGATTPDASGNLNILVGQGCAASLVGIPDDLRNNTTNPPVYSWTVSDLANTFQSWNGNSGRLPVAAVLGPGVLTNPIAHWYWNEPNKTTATVSCTVKLTPPTGQGAAFSITLTQQVIVQVPTLSASGTGSYMQINTKAPKDTQYELWGSMDWTATFQTPTSPAFGQGTIELVQIATPYQADMTNTTPPTSERCPHYGVPFMDLGCPYNGHSCTEAAQPYTDSDNPGQQLTVGGQTYAASASDSSVFTDFIMYSPPGTDTQWVPLATFNWELNGKATLPNSGQWSGYVAQYGSDAAEAIDSTAKTITPSTTTPFSPANNFPSWNQAF